jgi:hypothetical protein
MEIVEQQSLVLFRLGFVFWINDYEICGVKMYNNIVKIAKNIIAKN